MDAFDYIEITKNCVNDVYMRLNKENKGKEIRPVKSYYIVDDVEKTCRVRIQAIMHPEDVRKKRSEIKHYYRDI